MKKYILLGYIIIGCFYNVYAQESEFILKTDSIESELNNKTFNPFKNKTIDQIVIMFDKFPRYSRIESSDKNLIIYKHNISGFTYTIFKDKKYVLAKSASTNKSKIFLIEE